MSQPINIILAFVAAYVIGSVPTAYIFGRWLKGIDIRTQGSGNVGATNAFRVLGKGPGTAVLLIDIIKGIVPTAVVPEVLGLEGTLIRVVLGIVAVCGHNWTIFLQFKGGKGIATGLGVLLGLMIGIAGFRPVVWLTLASWIIVFGLSGYVSLASLVAVTILPVLMVLTQQPWELQGLGVLLSVFVWIRHRANLKRLLSHQENRVKILPFHHKKTSS